MSRKIGSKGRRSGTVLVLITLILPVLLGLVGLGIDGTMCYIVQTELSAAVDGAALGTGRLLSTNANPTDIATEFLNANFRVGQAGFWNSYNLVPTITVQTGTTKTVIVDAKVNVPLLFLRMLRFSAATITATATATRRDARIEFVIDRSNSMNTSDGRGSTVITDVIQYAQGFTQQFTNGYDELGLVVFGRSGVVGYPTSPWPSGTSPTGSGGPDTSFNDGTSDDMVHQIGLIQAGGGTAMGDGLALAYIELQKAHMRDMASLGKDTRMNAIVLFTDGVPSSVATYLNRNGATVINSGSGCTYRTDAATPTNPMYGSIVQGSSDGNPPYTAAWGFWGLASLDAAGSHTSAWYMANPSGEPTLSNNGAESGCNSNWNPLNNLNAIPASDKYGYPLSANGNGYRVSAFSSNPHGATSIYNGSSINFSNYTTGYDWGLAAWDEADQVAEAIRTDANYANRTGDTSKMYITIYTIGYTGNGGTDYGLLQKIANAAGSSANGYSTYNNAEPAGLYIQASDTTSLSNAFATIATAILRLAH